MMYHILSIAKQTGSLTLDETACYEDMKDDSDELYQEESKTPGVPQPMFRCVDGKLQIFDGGYESDHKWSDRVNLWGYCEMPILKVLAKHLKGKGTIKFAMNNEGNTHNAYTLTGGKVKKIF